MASLECLYRGTPRKDVDQFTPKEMVGGKLVVSASSNKTVALKFVVSTEGLKVWLGSLGDKQYYICAEEERFKELDAGGAVYTLSSNGFKPAPEIGTDVWVSQNTVIPLGKEEVSSALEAMVGAGVQVYFVSKEILGRFINNPENRPEILQSLVSVNVRQTTSEV